MGRGHACWLNAVNSLRLPRVQPVLLGLLCWPRALGHRVPSIRGRIGVATWRSSRRDFGSHAWHWVGARSVLSRRGDLELEILLHGACHFLDRNYGVFDCGGVALSKARIVGLMLRNGFFVLVLDFNIWVLKRREAHTLLFYVIYQNGANL